MPEPRENPPEIGNRLHGIRKSRRLTLDQLARGSGINKSMLSQIDHRRDDPNPATAWDLNFL